MGNWMASEKRMARYLEVLYICNRAGTTNASQSPPGSEVGAKVVGSLLGELLGLSDGALEGLSEGWYDSILLGEQVPLPTF